MDKYFMEDGSIDPNIKIKDKSIPCVIRFGYRFSNMHPCTGCPWRGCCNEEDSNKIEERMDALKQAHPHLFDGTIQTRNDMMTKSWS